MNLLVLGPDIQTRTLKELAGITGATRIERVDDQAFRLVGARTDPAVEALCARDGVDCGYVPADRRLADFGLMAMDMDSTLITIECIDEIGDAVGVKAEIAAITERSMRGEIDFVSSLRERVALLQGVPESAIASIYEQRLQLQPGAERMLKGLRAAGVRTMLVSGGFTYFTERLRSRLGFDYAFANELEIADGRLTGRLVGPILDGPAKARLLSETRDALGLGPDQTIAIGDGANDRYMLATAGVGIAFRAKPILRETATYCFDHVGLDGLLSLYAG
ncbi:MAG: phosphoserine phosphatase SerB [Burkholderiales bacterium]|nr:phosphoserine phosphatase SerB [Burkholderiales bacterium]